MSNNTSARILLPDKKKEDTYRLLWMLGLALTLPMILLSGPLAGYLISLLLIQKLRWPSFWMPLLMGLGFVGSGFQSYQLIQKLNQSKKEKP